MKRNYIRNLKLKRQKRIDEIVEYIIANNGPDEEGRGHSSSYSYSVNLYSDGKFNSGFSSNGSHSGSNVYSVLGNTIINVDEWYHVAVVHKETDLMLYVNGQLDSIESNVSSTVFASNSDVFIGKLSDAYFINRNQSYEYQNRHAIDGSVDELRIYNRGLSDAEIQELYQMTTQVVIDIKPGSDPNSINLKSKGVIPVAILTTVSEVVPAIVFAGSSADIAGIGLLICRRGGYYNIYYFHTKLGRINFFL